MKKLISSLLILIFILGALSSCADVKYDEDEVKAAARELIEDSIILNDIYWGDGIPYTDDKNTSDGVYYMAIDSYHRLLGFNTIEELMTLTEKTFSRGYCKNIYSTVLTSIQDGDKAILLSRYYQKYNVKDGKTPEYIMVNSTWDKILNGEVKYDYDSIKVSGAEEETVYVTVNATVTKDALEPQTREIRIALVKEDNGWRIDSPTYLNYV